MAIDNQEKIKVCVYGTLKHGHSNHYLLEGAKLLSIEQINFWKMRDLGAFPAVHPADEADKITVEIYEIDTRQLRNLDDLEGCPYLYQRVQVETSVGFAWLYYMHNKWILSYKEIETGEW